MTNPKPKFCVGEEVMVRSTIAPEFNVDKAEIVKAIYVKKQISSIGYEGWGYQTDSQPDKGLYYTEPALRKLPPEDRISGKTARLTL